MKKTALFLVALVLAKPLTAQEAVGAAAAEASQSSDWQSWTFASTALVTAALGITLISMDTGTSSSQSH